MSKTTKNTKDYKSLNSLFMDHTPVPLSVRGSFDSAAMAEHCSVHTGTVRLWLSKNRYSRPFRERIVSFFGKDFPVDQLEKFETPLNSYRHD